jgi:hypothetical protein
MNRNETPREDEAIYLDELTLPATFALLRAHGVLKVTVLEAIKPRQKLWRWFLDKKGIRAVEAHFFTGHLRTVDGESVYLFARKLSATISQIAAHDIIQSEELLYRLNEAYQRNTIRLFIAKQLRVEIEYWIKRVLIAQALAEKVRATLWVKRPGLFDGGLLQKMFPGVDLRFYRTDRFTWIKLFRAWLLNLARDIKLTTRGLAKHPWSLDSAASPKPSVLTIQEDTLRADRSLRGQPHWLDVSDPVEMFDTYVLELKSPIFSIAKDAPQLTKTGVTIIPTCTFRFAARSMRSDKTLIRVRRDRRLAIQTAIRANGFVKKYFLLQVASLLRQAQLMGSLALWLNVRVFLIRETYYSLADAMQLVAHDLNVTTVAYQYSNMGFASPGMLSTADKYLIFAEMYKELYKTDGIAPRAFLATGYLYDGVASLVREKAQNHRDTLRRSGASFIVCYLDESVQHDRWGLVNKEDHLGEIYTLARKVLSDPEFGVIVKSQFRFNTPSQLYPKDGLIQAAQATGRYLELMDGVHRNNIYPTEAALVADICIGHKFGATGALEAAIAGVRTVLLDAYGARTLWDNVYSRANIECESLDLLMEKIEYYRSGNPAEKTLGDWTPILQFFDPYRDGKSALRLRTVLENAIQSAKPV